MPLLEDPTPPPPPPPPLQRAYGQDAQGQDEGDTDKVDKVREASEAAYQLALPRYGERLAREFASDTREFFKDRDYDRARADWDANAFTLLGKTVQRVQGEDSKRRKKAFGDYFNELVIQRFQQQQNASGPHEKAVFQVMAAQLQEHRADFSAAFEAYYQARLQRRSERRRLTPFEFAAAPEFVNDPTVINLGEFEPVETALADFFLEGGPAMIDGARVTSGLEPQTSESDMWIVVAQNLWQGASALVELGKQLTQFYR